ncbi:MAG TPA: hypothetical protein VLJ61_07935 [Pyrinomonadaceae bacterium]|nr:hypothetical protein [Pyrinomonadaceae bacterium]
MKIVRVILLLLCVQAVALADLKVSRKNGVGDGVSENTVYIKGQRQRTEMPGMTTIEQCDLKRTIQINDRTHKYMILPDAPDDTQAAAPTVPPQEGARQTRRGAIVTTTESIVDTGERKQMFGFAARHIKSSTVMDAPPEACNPGHVEVESDGWYIDLPSFSCPTERRSAQPTMRPSRPDCMDQMRYKRTGTGKLGFPLSVTTRIKTGGGDAESAGGAMTTTLEVSDISTVTLDPTLFDIPAGYTEAASMQELYGIPSGAGGMAGMMPGGGDRTPEAVPPSSSATPLPAATTVGAKRPGTIRVGVAAINNRAGGEVSLDDLRARLVSQISGEGVEAVPLDASQQMAAEEEAKRKDCDLLLMTDLSTLKQSAAGKIGGMFGHAVGVPTGGAEKFESRVDFKLYAVGGASQLESNATAKEDGAQASVSTALDREAKAVAAAARKKH